MGQGSWDGKYGGSWNELPGGWNEITLTYKKSSNKVNLYVNGKRRGSERTLGLGANFRVTNIDAGNNGHIGMAYGYASLADAGEVLERFTDIQTHFNGETKCTGAKLQYVHETTGVWTTSALIDIGSVSLIPDAPVATKWRVAGFSDEPGFCVMGMPRIE